MFEATTGADGVIRLSGRFDAAQVEKASELFDQVTTSGTVDFSALDYISSAGLGVLLRTQKRLGENGNALKLTNMNKHIHDVFHYAGFDTVFEIE